MNKPSFTLSRIGMIGQPDHGDRLSTPSTQRTPYGACEHRRSARLTLQLAWWRVALDDQAPALGLAAAAIAGCAAYFSVPWEPGLAVCVIAAVGSLALGVLAWQGWGWRRGLGLGAAVSLGFFAWSGAVAEHSETPRLTGRDQALIVSGWAERVDAAERGRVRVSLRVLAIEGLERDETPFRVRVTAPGPAPRLGQALRIRAVLNPPTGPLAPGAYNPALRAWFDRTGASGFGLGRFEALPIEPDPGDWLWRLAAWRGRAIEALRARAPPDQAGLLAALAFGDRSGVDTDLAEALRAAGLAHVLAISGLHMGLAAGGVFAVASFLFAAIPAVSRRWDARRPAALIALGAALAYLVISGGGTPTQRAFVMAGCAFFALLCGRTALSLRVLALATIVVLVLRPLSVIEPGFHMSFAAAGGLVAGFDAWKRRQAARPRPPRAGWLTKVWGFFAALSATSLIAGCATAPFGAYHFHRLAPWGFLANLFAMPVFTVIAAPALAAAAPLSVVGLDGAALWVAGSALQWLTIVARIAEAAPGAHMGAPAAPSVVLALLGAGVLLGLSLAGRARALSLAPFALALALWGRAPPPDLWLGEDGRFAAFAEDRLVIAGMTARAYPAEVLSERAGLFQHPPLQIEEAFTCDLHGCVGVLKGWTIAVTARASGFDLDCRRADWVIARADPPPRLARACASKLIADPTSVRARGVHAIWLTPKGPRVRSLADAPARLWRPRLAPPPPDPY
ncbi:MAG: ComEC/Rec2 family competence protein [Maricaulaceae bacterium]